MICFCTNWWNLLSFHLEVYLFIFFCNKIIVRANEFAYCWNVGLINFFFKIQWLFFFFAFFFFCYKSVEFSFIWFGIIKFNLEASHHSSKWFCIFWNIYLIKTFVLDCSANSWNLDSFHFGILPNHFFSNTMVIFVWAFFFRTYLYLLDLV